MINYSWTEKEEEIFNPDIASLKYFEKKPILGNRNIVRRTNGREEEVQNLYSITLFIVKRLKILYKEHPDFLIKDVNDKKDAKKITSKLIEKVATKI
ncbi:MAG: hypothetical protein ABIH65_03895 [Nanoarchaeota archaeon]